MNFSYLILAFVMGGLTNVVVEAKQNLGLELPKRLKTKWKLGFILDFFLGGIAGLLFVAITEPDTLLKTIGFSILGGFGGIATIERLYGKQDKIEEQNNMIEEKLKKKLK